MWKKMRRVGSKIFDSLTEVSSLQTSGAVYHRQCFANFKNFKEIPGKHNSNLENDDKQK